MLNRVSAKNTNKTSKTGNPSGTRVTCRTAGRPAQPGARARKAKPVIVVGGGPSGLRVAQELARKGLPVVLFNAERWAPYNRVKLTPLLAGDVQIGHVLQEPNFPEDSSVEIHTGRSILDVDRARRRVRCQQGKSWGYSALVLCTGSRAHVPSIPGIGLPGVYTFRKMNDVETLLARSFRSRRTVVIGGGLLGLEAARGMAYRGADTWVIEHESHLMPRQLDLAGGTLLAQQIVDMGITVRTGHRVLAIGGEARVEWIELSSGETIPCDSVIVCTGVIPNMEMARDAGLAVNRGIRVNETLQTSDPDIYAVGECAEFMGVVHGLVGPGLEQASVASAHISGEPARYEGSMPTTKLKVVGSDVFSMGDVDQLDQRSDVGSVIYENAEEGVYRRIVLNRGRLAGALSVGDWADVGRLQQEIRKNVRLWPWQLFLFRRSGRLWPDNRAASVLDWPAAATVCNCTGVTRGQLGEAIAGGCKTLSDLRLETKASTVCESCKPLLEELLGGEVTHEPVGRFRPLAVISALAAAAALVTLFAPRWPVAGTVQVSLPIDQFWIDGFLKQVSGFTLLGLAALAAVISLRKRVRRFTLGGYDGWRLVHVIIGLLAVATLFVHTGFRLGHNLNMWLMTAFLAASAVGALSGVVTAAEHALLNGPLKGRRRQPRRIPIWLHIVAVWPLPLLLVFHILSVYFY